MVRRCVGSALVLAVAASAPTAQAAEAPPRLSLASPPWGPYTDVDGRPRVALDLVHLALRRLGYEASTTVFEAGVDVMPEIEAGRFDGSAALWRSPERERYLVFSKPYLENRLVLVGRRGSDVDATRFEELAGRTIGLVRGYAYGSEIESARGPTFVRNASNEGNLRALLSGTIDYFLADALLVHQLFEAYPQAASRLLAVGTKPLMSRALFFALRKRVPGGAELVKRFDLEMERMLRDGAFHRVLGVAWIRADVDGDGRSELVAAGPRAGTRAPEFGYAVTEGSTSQASDPRFVVNGEVYERWEDVPERYKVPVERRAKSSQMGVVLLRF